MGGGIFAGGPGLVLGANYRSVGDQLGILWDDIKSMVSDIKDAEIQNKIIDFLRYTFELDPLDHDLTDDTFSEKLINIGTGNVQGTGVA